MCNGKLVGVTSYGNALFPCDGGKYPGVYVRVSKYIDWIQINAKTTATSNAKIIFPVPLFFLLFVLQILEFIY